MENSQSEFQKLLEEESTSLNFYTKGEKVKGKIVRIQDDIAFVDIGLKTEVAINRDEINDLKEGDEIEAIYLGRKNKEGYQLISRKPLLLSQSLEKIEKAFQNKEKIHAKLDKKAQKGFIVSIDGVKAYLPYSEAGLKKGEEYPPAEFEVYVIKFEKDRKNPNIVVSRKQVVEEELEKKRNEIFQLLKEGMEVEGKVVKILDKGAVLSLDDIIFGFLPKSLYSWDKNRSIDELSIGEKIKVLIKSIDKENQKILFSKRDLEPNPWMEFDKDVGDVVEAVISDINDFGLIVKVGELEGFIHKSETSHLHPNKYKELFKKGQKVKGKIIELDREKRRLKLSIKAAEPHPVDKFLEENPEGSTVKGEIKDIKNKVAFIKLTDQLEGILHLEDATWNPKIKNIGQVLKGPKVREFKVLGREDNKIRLGLKQFTENPWEKFLKEHKIGDTVKGTVKKLIDRGAFIDLGNDVEGFIPLAEISREKIEIPSDKLSLGQEIEAKIIKIKGNDIILSIKAVEKDKEREEIQKVIEKVKPKGEGLATLGELIKEKLKERGKA
jgi:small subunit ribosomal protein S1